MVERKLFFILHSLLFFLLLFSCGNSEEQERIITQREKAEQRRLDSLALKIAVMPTLDALPLYVAQDAHLFEQEDVDVRLRKFHAQMDCDTAVIGRSVEGVLTDTIRYQYIERQGTSLRVISPTEIYWQLIANRTSRLKQLAQFGDKMVAITRHSATDYLTDRAFHNVKTTAPVFRIQVNDVGLRLKMLLNNEMDAAWLPEPQATVARQARHVVVVDSRHRDMGLGVLAFRRRAMEDPRIRDQVSRFVKAYNKACDSINHYGFSHYGTIISRECQVDPSVVDTIPPVKYKKIKYS
ncbi:MAG: ABC transporter substrate-binding protein [Prevotella sp.]|nr:ABC transporter substrate-binding protein [Prevotella sp.]MBQ6211009.1 ABC transporter substrate-binding protein [Prevotella sp.]